MGIPRSVLIKDQAKRILARIEQLETAMVNQSASGITYVQIDGNQTRFSRTEILAELNYWKKKYARLVGARPMASTIYLAGS